MFVLTIGCLYLLLTADVVFTVNDNGADNPVFNLDHTALEKNIAAIFNKVAHSSATTKRSVPAYEAQVSQNVIHSTSPSPTITSLTTTLTVYPVVIPKVTNPPLIREVPSYAPPSRALFTPPLPPEYANPFADKPTLRGTNTDSHSNIRRPLPPPSLTPVHERIPIKPPDFIDDIVKNSNKQVLNKDKNLIFKDTLETPSQDKNLNETIDFIPSLHFTSISRILSGSNGRKQDIPDILLKPVSTKSPQLHITLTTSRNSPISTTLLPTTSLRTINKTSTFSLDVIKEFENDKNLGSNNYFGHSKTIDDLQELNVNVVNNEKVVFPQRQPVITPSNIPDETQNNQDVLHHSHTHSSESTLKIAWSLHVYLAATMFTLIALYSVYKIVRFNRKTNLLTQSYFSTIHLLVTIVCTLRCFYLFYDAYNMGHSLPEPVSKILMFLPSSLLAAAFSTLILYLSRCSTAPSLYHNKFSSPVVLVLAFFVHIILCISLHVSGYIFGYKDESKIFPLICQCIYIILCVTLGLCYMYVYRVIKSQLNISSPKSINDHLTTDSTTRTLNTAITTTIATALLFILMGFVQLYGIFGVQGRIEPYSWLWWGWQFSVRLIELSMCGLLAWVTSLSHNQFHDKQNDQNVTHSGFALFPCGSSTSTENMDDALYPAICSTNQAIQNYTLRTGKHVYEDSFPLNSLPEQFSSNNFERHSIRKSSSSSHHPHDLDNSPNAIKTDIQIQYKPDCRNKLNMASQKVYENSSSSVASMLVAEHGFVRFRNLGPENNILSQSQKELELVHQRKESTSNIDNFAIESSSSNTQQITRISHQSTLPRLHSHMHRNPEFYNNT